MAIFEELGDKDGMANSFWSIAQIEIGKKDYKEAFDHLATSYNILLKIGRLDGICMVGVELGQLLCMAGQAKKGLEILARSRDGFIKLDQDDMAKQCQAVMDQIKDAQKSE